ncbi:cytochrome C oxidase subunit IV family protein [Anaerolineales bacterium HSG25]|nr:cytochrome C oxidase subunit IV family protein [Anaerolineales bacterium HSG25]
MEHHVIPIKTYVIILVALLCLTAATVTVSFMPISPALHMMGAIIIAAVKTSLVVLYFMHVKYNDHVIWAYAGLGFLFVIFFFIILLGDYVALLNSLSPSTYAEPFDLF